MKTYILSMALLAAGFTAATSAIADDRFNLVRHQREVYYLKLRNNLSPDLILICFKDDNNNLLFIP
jgi:hypothetical protein